MKTSHKQPTKSKKLKTEEIPDETILPELIVSIAEPPEVVKVVKAPRGKAKVHYVNGKEFEEEIKQFYEKDEVSDKLAISINKIANGLSYAPNFINYSYKEDMVSDAILKMFSALKKKKFRLNSGFSPFSYFTTIAFHAFINRIKKEKKYHETITEYKEKAYSELMQSEKNCNIYVDPLKDPDNYNEQ